MSGTRPAAGEVARYVAKHGQAAGRVVKAVLISAVPPLMLKTESNPGGLPMSAFDEIRKGTGFNRSQFYMDLTMPFYGYNRSGAQASEAVRQNWWRQGMMGGVKAHYDGIKAFSETDQTEDPEVHHGADAGAARRGATRSCRSRPAAGARLPFCGTER